MRRHALSGMSLIEILVVVAIFAILGIIVARSVILTVGGSRKSESVIKVRENLEYASGVIERQLRNADSITGCATQPSDTTKISYTDTNGNTSSFSCVGVGGAAGHIASGSAQLTNDNVNVTGCSFTCKVGTGNNPSTVTVVLSAQDTTATGVQNASVTITDLVSLRNY